MAIWTENAVIGGYARRRSSEDVKTEIDTCTFWSLGLAGWAHCALAK